MERWSTSIDDFFGVFCDLKGIVAMIISIDINNNMALRALKGVRELRFLLCQSSQNSETLRYCFH